MLFLTCEGLILPELSSCDDFVVASAFYFKVYWTATIIKKNKSLSLSYFGHICLIQILIFNNLNNCSDFWPRCTVWIYEPLLRLMIHLFKIFSGYISVCLGDTISMSFFVFLYNKSCLCSTVIFADCITLFCSFMF